MHSNLSLNTNYLRLCLQLASFWSTGQLQLVVQSHIRHPKFSQTTTPPVVVSTNCHEGTSIWSCLLCGPSLWLRFGHILRKAKISSKADAVQISEPTLGCSWFLTYYERATPTTPVSYYIKYCSTFSLTPFFTQRTLPNFLSSHWKKDGEKGSKEQKGVAQLHSAIDSSSLPAAGHPDCISPAPAAASILLTSWSTNS